MELHVKISVELRFYLNLFFGFNISVAPDFLTQPSNRTDLSGRNVTFYCAAGGKPDPMITWKFSGGALPPHQFHNGNLTVLFTKNSVEYEGTYTCVVSNKAGEISATAWLTVDCKYKTSPFNSKKKLYFQVRGFAKNTKNLEDDTKEQIHRIEI